MDSPEPSRRARRAVPLMAGSLVAMVAASLIYLHPAFPSLPKGPVTPPPPSPSTVPATYWAQYDFITSTTGWALVSANSPPARFYVYRTTDTAKHWTLQLTADAYSGGQINFFDIKHGVLWIGSPVQLYRTSDGGSHWDAVQLPPYQVNLVTFSDAAHGWLLASEPDQGSVRHFLATTNGGNTWTELAWPKGAAWANDGGYGRLQFRGPDEGWLAAAGASEPTVYSTVDGGASWEPHAVPRPSTPPDLPFETFVGLLPGSGVIAYIDYPQSPGANDSFASTSIDGGITWRKAKAPLDAPSWNLTFQDSSHWWATYQGDVWNSADAGDSWKVVYQHKANIWVVQPQFIDAKHGWAQLWLGMSEQLPGGLAMTSDGGLHWTQVNAPRPS